MEIRGRREFIGGSLEARRVARLEQTCRDKFAKLANWKQNEAVRAVLVVEENDISSTNAERVFHALMRAEKGKPDAVMYITDKLPYTVVVLYDKPEIRKHDGSEEPR